ncbi:MAG: hypothetical protein HUJ52_03115 [Malacoplasma sp.]|nr:hypothetical protein [Malacoplasma sp.]
MLINQIPRDMALRDYAIASKSLCSYVDWENASVKSAIISWLEKDSPILGWTDDECPFVRDLSTDQLEIVPADHCANLSLYSAYNPNKVYKQKRQSQELVADPNKHYAAILMSDGDNVQWMQGEFRTNPWYGNANRGKFPMTWTVSPTTYDLNAQALDYIYGNQTDNDCFITSPSGFAYRNMGNCANNSKFTETSLKYMNDMDQHVVNFLDWNACNDPSKFEQFMKDPSVKGGVWSKGWLYMSGYGDINWVNDKPIISFREGLWNDTRSPGTIHNNLSVEEVSDRINEYPCDIESINGYTIVMCCCWALDGQMDRITEFVNRLAKHVELVTVDQLIDLAAKNIKSHKQATPDKHWW